MPDILCVSKTDCNGCSSAPGRWGGQGGIFAQSRRGEGSGESASPLKTGHTLAKTQGERRGR